MMKQNMMMALIAASMSLSASAQNSGNQPKADAQNCYQGHFTRSLHDVMQDVSQRWGVRFKYNVDTVGRQLPYADFRIKPYSLEESLANISSISTSTGGSRMVMSIRSNLMNIPDAIPKRVSRCLLISRRFTRTGNSLKHARTRYERRCAASWASDRYMDSLVHKKPILGKGAPVTVIRFRIICIETLPGEHVFGSIYYANEEGQASVDYLS